MESVATFLVSGVVFGLSAGISPGPLLTLVISETLKYGVKEGIKVAIAPLLTDVPIVLAALLVLDQLSDVQAVLGAVSLAGAAFLSYLAWESITFKGARADAGTSAPRSIRKGILANFLNPNPYLFWLSVGAPTVVRASERSAIAAVLFITGFYVLLVGSKVLLAVLAGKSRHFLLSLFYVWTVRLLGFALLFFAVLFFREGLAALGVL
jgi:threonine/homoserine/homoserine lactone efflux protein